MEAQVFTTDPGVGPLVLRMNRGQSGQIHFAWKSGVAGDGFRLAEAVQVLIKCIACGGGIGIRFFQQSPHQTAEFVFVGRRMRNCHLQSR